MLVRAARRKSRQLPRYVASTDFYMPWLCPALQNQKVQSRCISEDANQHGLGFRKRRNSRDGLSSIQPRRSLAMAAEMADLDVYWDLPARSESALPSQPPPTAHKFQVEPLLKIRSFDPLGILQESDPLAVAPTKYRTKNGTTAGSISDMYAVLQACFCVGQLKRAEAIIKRLMKLNLAEDQLMSIQEEFVRVSVAKIVQSPRDSDTQALHKWFELQIRPNGFHYTVLAYMLKASLRESSEKKRDRLVQRYIDLLPVGITKSEQSGFGILTEEEQELIDGIIEGREIKVNLDITHKQEHDDEDIFSATAAAEATAVEDVIEIMAVEQKGLGLSSLKESLSTLSKNKPSGFNPSLFTAEQQRARQRMIEESAVSSAINRWREENSKLTKMGMNTAIQTKNLGARMWKWQLALEQYLKTEIAKLDNYEEAGLQLEGNMNKSDLTIWLKFLKPEHLAAVTILSSVTRMSTIGMDKGIPLSQIIMYVGKAIEEESMALHIARDKMVDAKPSRKNKEKFLIKAIKRVRSSNKPKEPLDPDLDQPFPDITNSAWPMDVQAKVGAFLITGLIKTATIPVSRVNPKTEEPISQIQPAFFHAQQYRAGKRVGLLMANESLVDQMKREPVHSLLATHLPMVAEPEPWTNFNTGGFLAHPAKVMRVKHNDKDQRHYAEAAIQRGDMEQTFKALDVLGKQSWQINQPVLDTMIEAWNSGDAIAKIPAANPKLESPPKPSADDDPLHRKMYIRAVKLVENRRGGLHSQRCFQNFQIEIARALKDEVFYFPHNMDFRGRVYPIPPLLNHMGADHCRGLLKFGVAKELGQSGLRWLKIHLANVYGYDKASLTEREQFAEQNIDNIYDSATNPLKGKRWWLKSEDVWQTLATCIELKNALDSPDPTKYMSSLPVHQDGTCNGLQHYAALGGDEWGAKQVNLEPGDRPSDVYTAVSELVKEGIAKDLLNGDPCAKALDGKINRKIVKQTVMTNVYGVTYIGARAQVRKQLGLAYPDLPNTPDFHPGTLAGYIATKIFTALSTMFNGAHEIQHWLGECANRISAAVTPEQIEKLIEELNIQKEKSKSNNDKSKKSDLAKISNLMQFKSSVIWTTPLHMPVVQPYRVAKSRIVRTCLQRISLCEPHRSDPISKRKQLQAFPPNFVHSLDATHMMLSALKCYDLGLSFAAVHDSFWTHAADIDKMNGVLRDAFIQIHSEDIIGRLAAEFEVRYKGCFRLVNIKSGSPIVSKLFALRKSVEYNALKEEVLKGHRSEKDFKNSRSSLLNRQIDELLVEKKVADMLQSSDPEVVERARKIKTPSSLFREMAADEAVMVPAELAHVGIGDMPSGAAKQKANEGYVEEDMEMMESGEDSEFDNVSDESISNDVSDELVDEVVESTSLGGSDGTKDTIASEDPAKKTPRYYSSKTQKEHFARRASGATKEQSIYGKASFMWLPLTFPAVPKRGTYDVSRLKESKYFFS